MQTAARHSARDFAAFVERNLQLPTIPVVASTALKEMANPRTDGPKVAAIVARDQGLATRLLQMANSAAYGLRRKVTNLEHAAVILGFDRLKSLVLSASCGRLYRRMSPLDLELWLHSVACAGATAEIARRRDLELASEAFVAGLMHDVGKVVIHNAYPDRYAKIMARARDDAGMEATETFEREEFGFSHGEVGALLIRRWELSSELESCVLMHHDHDLLSMESAVIQDLTHAVALADAIVSREGLGTQPQPDDTPLREHPSAVHFGFEDHELADVLEVVRASFEADRELMQTTTLHPKPV